MLGAFACTAVLIVLLVGEAVLSVTGLSFDPHGYGMFAGILFAAVLTPVALRCGCCTDRCDDAAIDVWFSET